MWVGCCFLDAEGDIPLQIVWPDDAGFALLHRGNAWAGGVPGHGIDAGGVWTEHPGQGPGQHVPHVHSAVTCTRTFISKHNKSANERIKET